MILAASNLRCSSLWLCYRKISGKWQITTFFVPLNYQGLAQLHELSIGPPQSYLRTCHFTAENIFLNASNLTFQRGRYEPSSPVKLKNSVPGPSAVQIFDSLPLEFCVLNAELNAASNLKWSSVGRMCSRKVSSTLQMRFQAGLFIFRWLWNPRERYSLDPGSPRWKIGKKKPRILL